MNKMIAVLLTTSLLGWATVSHARSEAGGDSSLFDRNRAAVDRAEGRGDVGSQADPNLNNRAERSQMERLDREEMGGRGSRGGSDGTGGRGGED